MKKILSLLLVLSMLFAVALPALAEEGIMPISAEVETYTVGEEAKDALVILHTNDVHGGITGYAKVAALKAQFEAAGAEVLVVDAGDFSQGETSVSVSQGKTAIELMNQVGYELAAPGNHEFDYGYENLKDLEELAQFPILCANIVDEKGEPLFQTNLVTDTKMGKVGIFGLDTPETATKAHPAKIKGLKFLGGEELYECAELNIKALKDDGAQFIICLSHLGIDAESAANGNRSIDLLNHVTGIDLLIDGHSHSTLEQVKEATDGTGKVGETVMTSTGTKIANVGVVILKDGKVTSVENVPADTIALAEDDAILAAAQKILDDIKAEYGATFATSSVDLNGDRAPGNRTEETNLGDLICDAMLWQVTKDGGLEVDNNKVIAITNGGGIRAAIKAGDISKNDVNTVLPFGNTVATVYVTGKVLLEVLEASTFNAPEAVGGFPQVAGIALTVDMGKRYDAGELYEGTTYSAPKSINRVTIDSVNGEDFDSEATYAVITNDFLAAGGDTYYALSVAENIVDTGVPLDEALMAYITEVLGGNIGEKYAAPQGRITMKDPLDDFSDLSKDKWYASAVRKVVTDQLMVGSNGAFDPQGDVTAAQLYQVLYNLEGKPAATATVTTEEGAWYADAINWAAEAGLYEGESFTNSQINRSAVATVVANYCQSKDKTVEGGMAVREMVDYDQVPEVDQAGVDYCYNAKLMVGVGGKTLAPQRGITRAEFAKVIVNLQSFMAG